MSKIKEYRSRIKSVGNIKKITKSMQMIAVSKMRKAEKNARAGRDYHENIERMFKVISEDMQLKSNPLFYKRKSGKLLVVVFSPNRGFAGSMLINQITSYFKGVAERGSENVDVILVGKKMKRYISSVRANIIADFSGIGEYPTIQEIRAISQMVSEGYEIGIYNQVSVLYTDYINSLRQETRFINLLPATLENQGKEQNISSEFIFEPAKESILESLVSLYIDNSLYQFKAETVASEFAARMTAMRDATDKAEGLSDSLKMELNKLRQDLITRELGEISAGSLKEEAVPVLLGCGGTEGGFLL